MKTLIVEDDFTSRMILQKLLEPFSECNIAVNGDEALMAYEIAVKDSEPYDMICLDIMMPGMDGQKVLNAIRKLESDAGVPLGKGVKIVMTTALGDRENVLKAFRSSCDAYLVKPYDKKRMLEILQSFRFI
ncbi:MAG: response regulator [Victivallales bacterium]|jgi:two-component system chemotaxis response regulator CheY|nr:response regulator [Victivallales bacterium]